MVLFFFFFFPSAVVAVLKDVQTALAARMKETVKLSLCAGLLQAWAGCGKEKEPFVSLFHLVLLNSELKHLPKAA